MVHSSESGPSLWSLKVARPSSGFGLLPTFVSNSLLTPMTTVAWPLRKFSSGYSGSLVKTYSSDLYSAGTVVEY